MNGHTSKPLNLGKERKKERKKESKKANCDMCLVSCYDLKGEKYDNSINNLTAVSLYYFDVSKVLLINVTDFWDMMLQ
jgi:hypothetical protein